LDRTQTNLSRKIVRDILVVFVLPPSSMSRVGEQSFFERERDKLAGVINSVMPIIVSNSAN
jgi:hypothetical protein